MVRNLRGGKGAKKGKNKPVEIDNRSIPLPYKSDDEYFDYAVVNKKLGNGRLTIQLSEDAREAIGVLRGAFKSKKFRAQRIRFEVGSVLLISHRDWDIMWKNKEYKKDEPGQKLEQVDIVHIYTREQAKKLERQKEIPKWMIVNTDNEDDNGDAGFVFQNNNEEEEEDIDIDII